MQTKEYIIHSQKGLLPFNVRELYRYRDLLKLLFWRELVKPFKQSILGPFWFFVQPLFSSVVFTIIFGQVAKLSTDGAPQFLFYLCGTMCWTFFSACFSTASGTFIANQGLFGKVYFPRMIMPLSSIMVSVVRFFIQLVVLAAFWIYYVSYEGVALEFNYWAILVVPLALLVLALQGLGFGLILAASTAKYRDLKYVQGFFTQLWMYATPVIYPLSMIPSKYHDVAMINPLSSVFEMFRWAVLGTASISPSQCLTSLSMTFVTLFVGLSFFTRIEKNFIDTV